MFLNNNTAGIPFKRILQGSLSVALRYFNDNVSAFENLNIVIGVMFGLCLFYIRSLILSEVDDGLS